jgi:hypothetical protein
LRARRSPRTTTDIFVHIRGCTRRKTQSPARFAGDASRGRSRRPTRFASSIDLSSVATGLAFASTIKSADASAILAEWAQRQQLPVYYHAPSLAQHIGETSTVWPGAGNSGLRRASTFVGEDFDALEL